MSRRPRLGDYFENRQEPGRDGLPTLSVTMNDGIVHRSELERRTETTLQPDEHLLVRRGDIAYNMMRMWQGACGLADTDGLVSPAYVVLAPKKNIDSRFAYHWFKSDRMIYLFWAYSHGLTEDRLRLYFDDLAEIPIAPPSIEQQRRIVSVLDAWDRAIDQSQRLIAAKRRRLLLARKIVFSDITGIEIALAEVADIATGVPAPQNREAFAASGKRFVRVSDLAALAGEQPDEPEFLHPDISNQIRLFPAGTMLFAKSGMSARLPRLIRLSTEAHLVSHLAAVQAKEPTFQSFIYHWLVENHPSALAQGDGFPSIRMSDVGKLPIPDLSGEQAALIGYALDAIEAEVRGEIVRLAALQRQKRGLMHRLLAGEWSLDGRFDCTLSTTLAVAGASA